jgi:hypothetical protein
MTSRSGSAALLCYLPAGLVLNVLLLSWLYAYYCYDYKWALEGARLPQRLAFLEVHWAFFAGGRAGGTYGVVCGVVHLLCAGLVRCMSVQPAVVLQLQYTLQVMCFACDVMLCLLRPLQHWPSFSSGYHTEQQFLLRSQHPALVCSACAALVSQALASPATCK